jgi:hypothetical protein
MRRDEMGRSRGRADCVRVVYFMSEGIGYR